MMMELVSAHEEIQGLLRQIHVGDDAAWEELLRLVHDRLEKLIRVMFRGFPSLRGFIEWEDVLQNVLVRLLRALRQIEPASMQEFFALAGAHVRRELLNQACKRKKVSARQAGLSANSERTFFDAPLAEESAAELDQWSRFHQEVEPGEVRVLGRQLKVGPIRTTDHEHVVFGERERLALVGSRRDG